MNLAQILQFCMSDDWRGQEIHELEVEKDHLSVNLKMIHQLMPAHPFKLS